MAVFDSVWQCLAVSCSLAVFCSLLQSVVVSGSLWQSVLVFRSLLQFAAVSGSLLQSVCPSVYLSVCLSNQSVCLLFISLSVQQSACLTVCLSIYQYLSSSKSFIQWDRREIVCQSVWDVYQSVSPLVCMSNILFVHQSVCQSNNTSVVIHAFNQTEEIVCQSFFPSVCLSIMSVCPSVCQLLCLSICQFQYVRLLVNLSVSMSVCLSVCL